MEFWGVEVKSGKPLKVEPEMGKLVHISQAALGEVKDAKSAKNVPLRLKIDGKKFVIGSLSAEERPQVMFDLVFEREFELSHDWKHGSVYFVGYLADEPASDDEVFSSDFEDESEEELVPAKENGDVKPESVDVKTTKKAAASEPVATAPVANGANKKTDDSDSSDEDGDDSGPSSDDDMAGKEDDSSDFSEDDSDEFSESSDEEEEKPKVEQTKKRSAETAEGTPVAKKAKAATPDKSGNKKGNHTATPFPSKAAPGKKHNGPSPKSFGGNKKGQFQNKGKRGGK